MTSKKDAQRAHEVLVESIKAKSKDMELGLCPGVKVSLTDRPGLYRKRLVRRCGYLSEKIALAEQPPQKAKWDQHELEALCWALACIDELIGRREVGQVK